MTTPQQRSPTGRSDADDVEQHACPKCDAQPGSPCCSRGGAVACAYHTRRFTKVPRLKKALRVPTPAGRGGPAPRRRRQPTRTCLDALNSKHGIPEGQDLQREDQHPGARPPEISRRRCGPLGRSRPTPRTAGSSSPCTR
ncbi:zinc finger domain-containing protein [Streptomyces solaniscabiei]|uniref:zinc finger domain-containing protein n=1 Tax=Streptomyces solaniscabiei TaxID=2683255 RepID=UPI003FD84A55